MVEKLLKCNFCGSAPKGPYGTYIAHRSVEIYTLIPLGLFVKKLNPKVGLEGYDILFAYFVVEVKSKILWIKQNLWSWKSFMDRPDSFCASFYWIPQL